MTDAEIKKIVSRDFRKIPSECVAVDYWKHKDIEHLFAFTPTKQDEEKLIIAFVHCEDANVSQAFNHHAIEFTFKNDFELMDIIIALNEKQLKLNS